MKKLSLGLCGFLLVIGSALIEKRAFATEVFCNSSQTVCMAFNWNIGGVHEDGETYALIIPVKTIRALAAAAVTQSDASRFKIELDYPSSDGLSFSFIESADGDDVFVH